MRVRDTMVYRGGDTNLADIAQAMEGVSLTSTNSTASPSSSSDDVIMTPRKAVEKAEAANLKYNHECQGSLSFSHGFAPRLTPMIRFPQAYKAWDDMADKCPQLLSSGRLQKYCEEELPELDAENLPDKYAMRAALVLGYTAHAIWNLGGIEPVTKLPRAIEIPWRVVSKVLGRETPFLGFSDMIVHNFMFRKDAIAPPLPSNIKRLFISPTQGNAPILGNDELELLGGVDYDPSKATVTTCRNSFSVTQSNEEEFFNVVMAELHCVGAPMVRLVVEAQEAVSEAQDAFAKGQKAVAEEHVAQLKEHLISITNLLNHISHTILAQISQLEKSSTYVGVAFWARIIGPVSTPMFKHNIGAASSFPFIHMFDAFFGRTKHEHYVGKDKIRLFPSLPAHWQEFFTVLLNGPSICKFVHQSDDTELKGLFGAALRSFAADEGFLGRHKLKMYGYLEVVMKLGRTLTIGGFGGLFKDRAWDKLFQELKIGQAERFDIPVGVLASGVHKAKIIQARQEDIAKGWGSIEHIQIDITNCGIRYRPGSRVGVLFEPSKELIQQTLLAFAKGNESEAAKLATEHKVVLSGEWRKAICDRPDYHDIKSKDDIPKALELQTFLKYADLRPVTRAMLQNAFKACGSSVIAKLLENHLESSLQFPDVVSLIQQSSIPVLGNVEDNERALEVVFNASDLDQTGYLESFELESLCAAAGLTSNNTKEVQDLLLKYDGQDRGISLDEFKKTLGKHFGRCDICELVQPAAYRVYSVASSPSMNPNAISLYITHVRYDQISPSAPTTPLLAGIKGMTRLELRYGAASDYLVRESTPVQGLAIEAARELSKQNSFKKIHVSEKIAKHLELRGNLSPGQAGSVMTEYAERRYRSRHSAQDIETISEVINRELSKDVQAPKSRSVVLYHFEPPMFKLPPRESDIPIVMIAGGTGIAPFRSFWQERALIRKPKSDDNCRDLLIFQTRFRSDIPPHLGSELASLVRAGYLDVQIMLSQEEYAPIFTDAQGGLLSWESSPSRKGYIDSLLEGPLREHISHLVKSGAHFYVCGRGGFAKMAINSLEAAMDNGKEMLEEMVASDRLSLEVFTTLKPPQTDVEYINMSELCTCNDIVGNRSGPTISEKKLLMAIEDEVYDITAFLSLHPGGASIMHLYCGMDATKAWKGVDHDKQPEIVGMLEMYSTKKRLRNVATLLGIGPVQLWYTRGWRLMADVLVEVQNIVSLSYHSLWDQQAFTIEEETVEMHWCTWNGEAKLSSRKSLFKGQKFVEVHLRLWLQFLPMLLGEEFKIMLGGEDNLKKKGPKKNRRRASFFGSNSNIQLNLMMDEMKNSSDHKACDVFGALILEDLKNEATGDNPSHDGMISSRLQALMEKVRILDEIILESMKSGLILGLEAFEDAIVSSSNEVVAVVGSRPAEGIEEIGLAIATYIKGLAQITLEAFGDERVTNMIFELNSNESSADPSRPIHGGLHLAGSEQLKNDFVVRHLVDSEGGFAVEFGEVNRDGEGPAESNCLFSRPAESKCPFSGSE